MRIGKKIISGTIMSLLIFSILSISWRVHAQGMASLTGNISDSGVDTDIDGTFDYLEVGVEVNVSAAGMFQVEISGLYDSTYRSIGVWGNNSTYLDVGVQVVDVSLDGPSIYASGFNPAYVSSIYLYDEYHNQLDYLSDVPLSREYNYTEFDSPPPPPEFLTGTIYDRGVDTDGDGSFDYLEVGVEVNVTNSGDYEVEIRGLLDSGHNYIRVLGQKSEYLDAGIHVVNVSLYGPTIYVSGLNPVNVSEITLYSVDYVPPLSYMRTWRHFVSDVPLSQEYLYTEFDSPFNDVEAIFVVYPDGRVVMEGALIYTDMEPPYTEPPMYGVAEIKKSDALTLVSANFTLTIPLEEASQFPFNSSAFTLLSEYSGGLLTTTISGSTIFPPSLASMFPLNATDFTVRGEYTGDMVTGNVTVDMLPGFPLDDIVVDFQGNNTYVYVEDSLKVIYGTYPDFGEINATVLDALLQQLNSTIPGKGSDSLYNMTGGLFECTMLNITATYNTISSTIDFEAEFQGNLIQALVSYAGQPHSMYELLNATWSSVESGSLALTYAHAVKEANMDLVSTVDMTYLIDNMIPILPEILRPEEAAFIESILNTTYCTVNSAQVSLDYENEQATLTATATIQNDFSAEINYIKSLFLIYGDLPPMSTSQLQTLNETQIDLTNFRMSLNLTETSLEADASGFAVLPPLDWINATSFKLYSFFNATASEDEPPREGEKLKVTVEGASNATHTVSIVRPGTVPEPDISDPDRMIWNNQSISSLKDLIFQIELDNTPPVIGTPVQTPEIPDADEAVTVSVNVTDAATGVRPDGVILSYSTDDGETWNNVTMSKTTGDTYEGEIPGLPAGTNVQYKIIAYDNAGNSAINDNNGQHFVYTIPQAPFWTQWWFWVIVVAAIAASAVAVYLFLKKRKPPTPTAPPPPAEGTETSIE